MRKNTKAAGTARELAVMHDYRARGYVAFRTPASLGVCDVIALKSGEPPLFIEVKANTGSPYKTFTRADRKDLSEAAAKAGALAYLCHWPPRGEKRMIGEDEWPKTRDN